VPRPREPAVIRPARILAITRRDLRIGLAGRQGLAMVWISAALLGGTATVALPEVNPKAKEALTLSGEVPPAVAALEGVQVIEGRGKVRFATDGDGVLVVTGPVNLAIRTAMDDGREPAVIVEGAPRNFPTPGRTMLLALLSASVLSGALTESLPGERARGTLTTLLSAAISPVELVVGKWLAWTLYGTGSAVIAAAVAVGMGRAESGWWWLPLTVVPGTTVAVGLYLVRRAADVVGGATTTLRVIPLLLGGSALTAWALGDVHPLLGAAVPLGGAIITAGATWPGAAAPILGAISAALLTAALLWGTARHLRENLSDGPTRSPLTGALTAFALLAPALWIPVVTPPLWGLAGNPGLTAGLAPSLGLIATHLAMGFAAALYYARDMVPRALRPASWPPLALAVAAILGLLAPWAHLRLPTGVALTAMASRTEALLVPAELGVGGALLAVSLQELLFRGAIQRTLGPWASALLFAALISPTDPLPALMIGAGMSFLTHRAGQLAPALLMRGLLTLLSLWMSG
ncbi:MAG: hypothetical protein JXX28_04420, partial [Deltaproteobacteria bacterium]|nr:hypothetical protein [Deltaproteobacteria bacterium]